MKKALLFSITVGMAVLAHAQWTNQASGFISPSAGVFDICVVDANVVWAVPYDGSGNGQPLQEFTKTTDGGTTWNNGMVTLPASSSIVNISALDANTAWASAWDGAPGPGMGVFKTTNGGATWTQQGAGLIFIAATSFTNFVHFKDANNGVVMGDPAGGYFEIYTTTDGGATWTRVPQANIPAPSGGEYGLTNDFHVIGNTIWWGSYTGRVFKSIDYGLNWTVSVVTSTNGQGVSDVFFRNQNEGLAKVVTVSNFATVNYKKTNDGGATWATVTPVGTWYEDDFDGPPNSATYVSTGANTTSGNVGSAYSVDGGVTWINIDNVNQHTTQGWANGTTGWCGGFTLDTITDGMYKYTGAINLGVEALNRNDARMRVYPNPTSGVFNIQIGGAEFVDAILSVSDVSGRIIFTQTLSNSTYLIEEKIDLSGIAKGIYFVNVKNGGTNFSDKLVIK